MDAVVAGDQIAMLFGADQPIGGGEFERPLAAAVNGTPVTWTERVQVIRAHRLART